MSVFSELCTGNVKRIKKAISKAKKNGIDLNTIKQNGESLLVRAVRNENTGNMGISKNSIWLKF